MDGSQLPDDYFSPPSLLSYKFTGVIGVLAFVINVFILLVFVSNKRLRTSSALVIALTAAHALSGAIHSIVGFWPVFYAGTFVTSLYCVSAVWPEIFIAVYQLIPILLALNAVERLLALTAPVWYRKNCTHSRLWFLAGAVGALGIVLIIVNGIKGWLNDGPPISGICIPSQIFSMEYMVAGVHTMAILGGVLAVTCTSVGMYRARRKIDTMPSQSLSELGRVRKQLRLTQCLLMISVIDVICVVVPNVVLELFNTGNVQFPLRYVIYPVIIYCSDSVWNIAAFLLFNREFRKAALKITKCKKPSGDSQLFINVTSQKGSRACRSATAGAVGARNC